MSSAPLAAADDAQLVAQILAGQAGAFAQLVQRTERLVSQLVFKMIRHPADRPDIAQEVYLKVFQNLAGFQFQAKLSTWVGQIAYNTCLHYLEKKKLVLLDLNEARPEQDSHEGQGGGGWWHTAALVSGDDADPTTALLAQDRTDILAAAIEQLPPLYRTLIGLYHQQELSCEEIGQITALPTGTVKNYLFRARRLMKEHLLTTYDRDEL